MMEVVVVVVVMMMMAQGFVGLCERAWRCRAVYKGVPGYGSSAVGSEMFFWEGVTVAAQRSLRNKEVKGNETGGLTGQKGLMGRPRTW